MTDTISFFKKARPVWQTGAETLMNTTLVFEAECPASESAILRVTGASYYNIYVNGEFTAVGPARTAHGYYRVDELPIKLDKKSNTVKIIVMGYAANSFCHIDAPSFIQAEIETEEGVSAYTDAMQNTFHAYLWNGKLRKVQRYSFQRPFCEVYDFTREQYTGVELSETEEKRFLPRGVFYGEYEKEDARSVIQRGTFGVSDKEKYYEDRSISDIGPELKGFKRDALEVFSTVHAGRLDPVVHESGESDPKCVKIRKGEFATYDMGKNLTGLIGFEAECDAENTITVVFDEILYNDSVYFTRMKTANVIILKTAPGKTAFLSVEPYTFKYIRVFSENADAVIKDLHIRRIGAPAVNKKLKSDDEKLQLIFDAAIETYRQNTFDIYMDCPSRERAGWLCDSFFTSRVERTLTGKSVVEKNFIENFILPDSFKCLPEGMLPMCYPSDHYDGVFIPNWAMWFVVELEEYMARTADSELIAKAKDKAYALLKYFRRFENEYGLLEKLESWVFLEWSKSNELVQDVNFPSNMLYAKMKQVMADLYDDSELAKEASDMRDTIRSMSYTDAGFFCDNAYRRNGKLELSGEYTESCQYYAFHTGTATPEMYPELWECLVKDFGMDRRKTGKWPNIHFANAFIGNYLRLDLLSMYGSKEVVLKNIADYFTYMAEKTGTLWENESDHASCNHGFASHVLYWFDKFGMIE